MTPSLAFPNVPSSPTVSLTRCESGGRNEPARQEINEIEILALLPTCTQAHDIAISLRGRQSREMSGLGDNEYPSEMAMTRDRVMGESGVGDSKLC